MKLEVPLPVSAADAWAVLVGLPQARGSAAGYDGTAVLVDADDDARTATLRLQGAAGPAIVAATAVVSVLEGGLSVSAELSYGVGGPPIDPAAAEEALGHLATTLAYALATAHRPRVAWDAAVPPAPTPADVWDTPSPLPARSPRARIAAGATLAAASPSAPTAAAAEPSRLPAPLAPMVAPPEVLTPRPHDVVHPGEQAPEGDELTRWVRRGAAAAAALAALRILRGRR